MEIYNKIKDYTVANKKKYLATVTAFEKEQYKKYVNKLNQAKFRENNKEKSNEVAAVRMRELRKQNPDKYRKMNIEHNKQYRTKNKQIRQENINFAKDIVNDIINDVIKKIEDRQSDNKLRSIDILNLVNNDVEKKINEEPQSKANTIRIENLIHKEDVKPKLISLDINQMKEAEKERLNKLNKLRVQRYRAKQKALKGAK
jgi:hypothetical protein